MDNISSTTATKPLYFADAAFRIGTSHERDGSPCQDYALAESDAALPFAIISDGCSTAGETDLGSRILARVARSMLLKIKPANYIADLNVFGSTLLFDLVNESISVMRLFDLTPMDMDATVGLVQATPDGGVRTLLFGDGVLAAHTARGLEIIVVKQAGSMPGYPIYLANGLANTYQEFVNQSEAIAKAEGIAPWHAEHFLVTNDGVQTLNIEIRNAAAGLTGYFIDWPPGTDVALVMTDGVEQVGKSTAIDVVAKLAAVKSAREGSFMKRRMQRALRDFAQIGDRPADDISVAALVAASVPKEA